MEVGPTTHYIMGGVWVDADTQMSNVPGLFAAGESAGGLHGANRLGGNSLSDLLVFGKRAGEHAAQFAAKNGAGKSTRRRSAAAKSGGWPRRARRPAGIALQAADRPAGVDATSGRIVPARTRWNSPLDRIAALPRAAEKVVSPGNRDYKPAGIPRSISAILLTCSEAVTRPPSSARRAGEGTSATTFREVQGSGDLQPGGEEDGRRDESGKAPAQSMPPELKAVIEAMK